MRFLRLLLFGLALAGCSNTGGGLSSIPPSGPSTDSSASAPNASRQLQPLSVKPAGETLADQTIYTFRGTKNGLPEKHGGYPNGALVEVNGTLYGSAYDGGSQSGNCAALEGCGTIFSVSTDGNFKLLHTFTYSDGARPSDGLVALDGILYGTTRTGAGGFYGTAFRLDPSSGALTTIHTFGSGQDGALPSNLIVVNGTLYGVTQTGGVNGDGTIFKINPLTGSEQVIHSFNNPDDQPTATLAADTSGTLYGVTSGGGSGCKAYGGCGTLFKLDPSSGTFQTLHRFKGGAKGQFPGAGLTYANGVLYGTAGGGIGCQQGCGIVFEINPSSGAERTLYQFRGGKDGAGPEASLTYVNGKLYGTTEGGGGPGTWCDVKGAGAGCGTVFVLDLPTGSESVLHSFGKRKDDGIDPAAGSLLDVNGVLYGTTAAGGDGGYGHGAIFTLTGAL